MYALTIVMVARRACARAIKAGRYSALRRLNNSAFCFECLIGCFLIEMSNQLDPFTMELIWVSPAVSS